MEGRCERLANRKSNCNDFRPGNMSPQLTTRKSSARRERMPQREREKVPKPTTRRSETNAYVAPGVDQGDASEAPGTKPGAAFVIVLTASDTLDYYQHAEAGDAET